MTNDLWIPEMPSILTWGLGEVLGLAFRYLARREEILELHSAKARGSIGRHPHMIPADISAKL